MAHKHMQHIIIITCVLSSVSFPFHSFSLFFLNFFSSSFSSVDLMFIVYFNRYIC